MSEEDKSLQVYMSWALPNVYLSISSQELAFSFVIVLYPFFRLPKQKPQQCIVVFFFLFIFLFLIENTFTATKACYCMISYKCREVSENPFRINNTQTILVNEKV